MEKEPKIEKKERSREELIAEFDELERDFWNREAGGSERAHKAAQKIGTFESEMSQEEKVIFYEDKERLEKLEEMKRSSKQFKESAEKPYRTWDQRELD